MPQQLIWLSSEVSPPDTLHIQRRPAVERDTTVQDWVPWGGGGGRGIKPLCWEGGREIETRLDHD